MAPSTRRRSRAAAQKSPETKTADATDDDAPLAEVPQSPEEPTALRSKRKSSPEAEDSEGSDSPDQMTSQKRQNLAVRVRQEDEVAEGKRRVSIEAQLLGQRSKRDRSEAVADSQDESEDNKEIEPASASKQLKQEAMKSRAPDPAPTPAPAKAKHVVFGDDDDVDNFISAAKDLEPAVVVVDSEDQDDGDDDDDAPEAVSTKTAAKDSLKSEQAAAKAAEKQAASLKRKRKERDDLLKQQAQKRKRTTITTEVEIHQPKSAAGVGLDEGPESRSGEIAQLEKAVTTATSGRRRAEKFNLPGMLPAEFLTDSESDDEDDEKALKKVVIAKKNPQKITFETAVQTLDKAGKVPRDQVIGSTAYRVMGSQGDKTLAPKMNKNSRNMKDALLRRNRVGGVPAKNKGFFKRK